jgi:hypothetical protein
VATESELLAAAEAAFGVTGRGFRSWPDPHPGLRTPRDEEYSRVTDPGKWRIVGARAEAWLVALVDAGLAVLERDAEVRWQAAAPGPVISRTDRLVPHAAGALPLVVARSRIDDVADAGVTLGAGHPAVCVRFIPDCGCDACDSGSQDVLDELDRSVLDIVLGGFRHLSRGEVVITVRRDGWSATGTGSRDVRRAIAEPGGWDEVSGASWLSR